MLRAFRRADAAPLAAFISTYFPEEGELLRWRPGAFEAIVEHADRPHIRFLLWLLDRLRHPIVKVFALEVDGRLAGAAIVSFPPRAGYISSVVVDAPYRGRGYAKQIMGACESAAAHARRSYVVLDVIRSNTPARALYAKLGYQNLRLESYYVRDYDAAVPGAASLPSTVRPFVSRDAAALVPVAQSILPPRVAEVLPVTARQFSSVPLVVAGLKSETEAWVLDRGQGAEGFVRATVSAATESGHLTAPLFAPGVSEESARAAIRTATDWLRQRAIRRIVCEMHAYNTAGIAALAGEGFREALTLETLYHPIAR